MDRVDWWVWLVPIFGGMFVASISRLWKIINNLHLLHRKADGSVHWVFEGFYLLINSILGGMVGLGAYVLIQYSGYITDQSVLTFISCMFATASGEAFTLVQGKVIKTMKKLEKEDLPISKGNK